MWQKNSFLLELKPHTNSASLFACCFDRGTEEALKFIVSSSELEVCPFDDAVGSRKTAVLSAIKLQEDSVAQCSWADNTTLQCKLTVASIDSDIDVLSGTSELAGVIKGRVSLRKFNDMLQKATAHQICCGSCRWNFLAPDANLSKFMLLPSEHALEMEGELFCHDPCGFNQAIANNVRDRRPSTSQCFLTETLALINAQNVTGISHEEAGAIECARCGHELGRYVEHDSKNATVEFYHCAMHLSPVENGNHPFDYLMERFGNVERWFTWMLLTGCDEHTTLKFCVKTMSNAPKILIWLLESYAVFVSGKLETPNGSIGNGHEVNAPYPVVKVLYKVFDEETASDPRANGGDWSVQAIHLPTPACFELSEILLRSTQSLPPSFRNVGQFYVGYLKIADNNAVSK